jgi:hypothetical protein
MNTIPITLKSDIACLQMVNLLKAGEKLLINALERSIEAQLRSEFLSIFQNFLKKDVNVKIHNHYFKNRTASVIDLSKKGYETWYANIKLCCWKENEQIEKLKIVPNGFNLEEIAYGYGDNRNIKVKKKKLKTQVNYIIEFLHMRIMPDFFTKLDISGVDEGSQLVLCNLEEQPQMSGLEIVSFTNAQSGKKYFCRCAEKYHQYVIAYCDEIKSQYVIDSWPHRLKALLADAVYKEGVCHICIATLKGIEDAKTKYCDGILFNQRPYICQAMFDHGFNKTTASADIKMKLGISKWKNEALLYSIVKSLFIGCMVEREYSPSWLGRQRLDIFLPEKKLAIEYQGEQHFTPVGIFGGEIAFEKGRDRDYQKLEKCRNNNIDLVYFNYNEPLTDVYIKKKLNKFLNE